MLVWGDKCKWESVLNISPLRPLSCWPLILAKLSRWAVSGRASLWLPGIPFAFLGCFFHKKKKKIKNSILWLHWYKDDISQVGFIITYIYYYHYTHFSSDSKGNGSISWIPGSVMGYKLALVSGHELFLQAQVALPESEAHHCNPDASGQWVRSWGGTFPSRCFLCECRHALHVMKGVPGVGSVYLHFSTQLFWREVR